MVARFHPGSADARAAGAAPAARADGPVGDGAPCYDAKLLGALVDSYGLDLDAAEHLRQDRLKRWQTPPVPTRKASDR